MQAWYVVVHQWDGYVVCDSIVHNLYGAHV